MLRASVGGKKVGSVGVWRVGVFATICVVVTSDASLSKVEPECG